MVLSPLPTPPDLTDPAPPGCQRPCPAWISVVLPLLDPSGPALPGSQQPCPIWISAALPCLDLSGPALPGSQRPFPAWVSAVLPLLDLRSPAWILAALPLLDLSGPSPPGSQTLASTTGGRLTSGQTHSLWTASWCLVISGDGEGCAREPRWPKATGVVLVTLSSLATPPLQPRVDARAGESQVRHQSQRKPVTQGLGRKQAWQTHSQEASEELLPVWMEVSLCPQHLGLPERTKSCGFLCSLPRCPGPV